MHRDKGRDKWRDEQRRSGGETKEGMSGEMRKGETMEKMSEEMNRGREEERQGKRRVER